MRKKISNLAIPISSYLQIKLHVDTLSSLCLVGTWGYDTGIYMSALWLGLHIHLQHATLPSEYRKIKYKALEMQSMKAQRCSCSIKVFFFDWQIISRLRKYVNKMMAPLWLQSSKHVTFLLFIFNRNKCDFTMIYVRIRTRTDLIL